MTLRRIGYFILTMVLCVIISLFFGAFGFPAAIQGLLYFVIFYSVGVYLGHREERIELGLEGD